MKSTEIFPFTCGRDRPWLARIASNCIKLINDPETLHDRNADVITEFVSFSGVPEEVIKLIYDTEVWLSFSQSNFISEGRNVVVPSAALLELFSHTDLDHVRLSDLRFPWGAFYIHLGTSCSASIYNGIECPIDGAYIQHEPKLFSILFVSRVGTHKHQPSVLFRPMRQMMLDLQASDDRISERMASPALDQTFGYPTDTSGVSEAMKLIANTLCFISSSHDGRDFGSEYPEDAPKDLVSRSRHKRPALRASAKAELLKRGFSTIRILDVPPELRGRSGAGTGHELAAHWRRGHWRRQPHGVGRAAVRLLWIKPTIVRADKGPPDGGHFYTVDAR